MKLQRILITVFLVLSLSACMGIKFTYNNLDWLVPWYVEDFIELTDGQEELFEQEFTELWLWHRTTELPKYVESLKRLEADIADKAMSMEKLIAYQDEASDHYQVTATRVISEGIDLLSTLTDEQMEEITEIVTEEMADYEERVMEGDNEKRIKDRIKRTEKNFRKWIGKLTNKQKGLIEQWGSSYESLSEYRLAYMKVSRAAFFEAMEKRSDKEYLKERLLFLTMERDQLHTEEHLEARTRNRDRSKQLTLAIEASLTKKQRKRLLNRIRNYRESFEELVEEVETSA